MYIGTQFWNQGRTQEIKDRVTHIAVDENFTEEMQSKMRYVNSNAVSDDKAKADVIPVIGKDVHMKDAG